MNAMQSVQSSGLVSNIEPRDSAAVAGDVYRLATSGVSGSAEFIQAMTMSDLFNAAVTTIAHNRGVDHALPGMPTTDGITDIQGGDFFSSAVVEGGIAGAWGIAGMVGLSIFILGNIYVTLHQRLSAHHNAVIMLHKCYGVLLRIENFLSAAQLYCEKYHFQIDSLEIQEDLTNIFKLLDEITIQADVVKVYENVIRGKTFRLETVDGTVIPVPEENTRGGLKLSLGARMAAGIRRVTVDINGWCNRFNSIMIEMNTHFTLLVSEFFMLSNLHQLSTDTNDNRQFAQNLLLPSVRNPVWCIQLRIMLAPLLRARIILFSCALSTNTQLCRETINSEMQQLEKARGFSRVKAYFERMYKLYKMGKKQIGIKPFIDILSDAVKNVEESVYYKGLPREYQVVQAYVGQIKENLGQVRSRSGSGIGRGVVGHENLANIVDMLDEIYNIVLSCGRLNDRGEATIQPFHAALRTAAISILPKRKKILPVYELQTTAFKSQNIDLDKLDELVSSLCSSAQQTSVNDNSYDVVNHLDEDEGDISLRIQTAYNQKLITDDGEKAVFARHVKGVAETQYQYNKLYTYVNKINPDVKKIDPEKRGREIAACFLILDRIVVGAITIPPSLISEICTKLQNMAIKFKMNNPMKVRTARSFSILLSEDIRSIHDLVKKVLDPAAKPVTRITRNAMAGPAMQAMPARLPRVEESEDENPDQSLLPHTIKSSTGEGSLMQPKISGSARFKKTLRNMFTFKAGPSSKIPFEPDQPVVTGMGGGRKMKRTIKRRTVSRHLKNKSKRFNGRINKKYTRRRNN